MPKSVFDGYLTESCKECESWSDGQDGRPLGCCTCFPIMHCDAFKEMYEKEQEQSKKGDDMKITVTLELDNPYDLDAEEIKKDIRMAEDQIGWNYDYKIVSIDVDQRTQSLEDAVRNSGEWIYKHDNLWYCSRCGEIIYSETDDDLKIHYVYCSRCGAKMKQEDR